MQDLKRYLPKAVRTEADLDRLIPTLAKSSSINAVEMAARRIPTKHVLHLGNSTQLEFANRDAVHLAVTSPPYWTLKRYRDEKGQLGHVEDYDQFLEQHN